jgi:hypothetical protein
MIQTLCGQIDTDAMMAHLGVFAQRVKLSGTPEELESFRYLEQTLAGYGYSTRLLRHDAYISLPGSARVETQDGALHCITHSFSRPSPTEGLRGELVHVGAGRPVDFAKADVVGKVALIEGLAAPGPSARASMAGAIGQIHISPHEHRHEMCISPVWGSPAPDALATLPRTVVCTVSRTDGHTLKRRVQAGEAVQVTLHAEVDTGWRQTPILVAELDAQGTPPDAPFVLFSGHHDTWHFGVMDNGAANATMLEVARIAATERAQWRRGLRLCFWSGHSHGRYSGSAWYVDHHWHELARRCVAHVNCDSTGGRGNTVLADTPASTELVALGAEAVRTQGGQEMSGLRMSRAGDSSFWGVGIPSLFMGMGEQPVGATENVAGGFLGSPGELRKGAGFGWWWHTPDDTLDKIDPELLARDTRIYVHAVWRLLTDEVLPFDYVAVAGELDRELAGLAEKAGGGLGVPELRQAVIRLRKAAAELAETAADPARATQVNEALTQMGRALVPIDYTSGDRFGHDPALPQSPYPSLDPLRALGALPAGSAEAKFAAVAAVRAVNRVRFAVEEAISAAEAARR